MRDWIIGLEKAAENRRPGVAETDWHDAETELQRPAPEELRDLYRSMNGAAFPSGVRLYPLDRTGSAKSVLVESRSFDDSWAFGERGDGAKLFTIQRGSLAADSPSVPDWVHRLDERQWIYGLRKDPAEVKFYRSLEQLLGVLVPPVQTEEFGDITYARAINALEGALQGLGADSDDEQDNQEVGEMDEELEETQDDRADDAEEIDDEGPTEGAPSLASDESDNDSDEEADADQADEALSGDDDSDDQDAAVGVNGQAAATLPSLAPVLSPPPRSLVRTSKDKEPTVGGRMRAPVKAKLQPKAKAKPKAPKKAAAKKAKAKASVRKAAKPSPVRKAKATKPARKAKATKRSPVRKVKAALKSKVKSKVKVKRPARKAARKSPAKAKGKKPARRSRR